MAVAAIAGSALVVVTRTGVPKVAPRSVLVATWMPSEALYATKMVPFAPAVLVATFREVLESAIELDEQAPPLHDVSTRTSEDRTVGVVADAAFGATMRSVGSMRAMRAMRVRAAEMPVLVGRGSVVRAGGRLKCILWNLWRNDDLGRTRFEVSARFGSPK